MTTKAEVKRWLEGRGWVFTKMTDAQKWEMRQELEICGAATSSSDYQEPCPNSPMDNGSGRCMSHGGASPKGIASPHYKHGRYSRYQPRSWLEAYQRSMDDPGLESLRRDLATSEAVIDDLMHRIDAGAGTPDQHAKLVGVVRSFIRAVRAGDAQAMARIGPIVEDQLEQDFLDAELRDELRDWTSLRRELAEAESRRVKRLQDTETAESAERRVTSLGLSVKQNVRKMVDRRWISQDQADQFLEWITADFLQITGPPMMVGPRGDDS